MAGSDLGAPTEPARTKIDLARCPDISQPTATCQKLVPRLSGSVLRSDSNLGQQVKRRVHQNCDESHMFQLGVKIGAQVHSFGQYFRGCFIGEFHGLQTVSDSM